MSIQKRVLEKLKSLKENEENKTRTLQTIENILHNFEEKYYIESDEDYENFLAILRNYDYTEGTNIESVFKDIGFNADKLYSQQSVDSNVCYFLDFLEG